MSSPGATVDVGWLVPDQYGRLTVGEFDFAGYGFEATLGCVFNQEWYLVPDRAVVQVRVFFGDDCFDVRAGNSGQPLGQVVDNSHKGPWFVFPRHKAKRPNRS